MKLQNIRELVKETPKARAIRLAETQCSAKVSSKVWSKSGFKTVKELRKDTSWKKEY